MTSLRVHFDGKVLIPEGPVDLPVGKSVEVLVQSSDNVTESPKGLLGLRFGERNGLPIIFPSHPGAPVITPEDIQRAEDEF
jgi:hypothetical protein